MHAFGGELRWPVSCLFTWYLTELPSSPGGKKKVHPYLSVAHRQGSDEAVDLAGRLSSWHDEMVSHARAAGKPHATPCDEFCPHARAGELWSAARDVLGEAADRFTFLRNVATGEGPAPAEPRGTLS
jgi:hypothetical protein